MTWTAYKTQLKSHVTTIYNKGLDTETLILSNGRGVSKYDSKKKKVSILKLFL